MEVGNFKKPANAIPRIPKLPRRVAALDNLEARLAPLLAVAGRVQALASFSPLNFANNQLASLKAQVSSRARQMAVNKLNTIRTPSFFPPDLATNAASQIQQARETVEELQALAAAAEAQIEAGLDTAVQYVELLPR